MCVWNWCSFQTGNIDKSPICHHVLTLLKKWVRHASDLLFVILRDSLCHTSRLKYGMLGWLVRRGHLKKNVLTEIHQPPHHSQRSRVTWLCVKCEFHDRYKSMKPSNLGLLVIWASESLIGRPQVTRRKQTTTAFEWQSLMQILGT